MIIKRLKHFTNRRSKNLSHIVFFLKNKIANCFPFGTLMLNCDENDLLEEHLVYPCVRIVPIQRINNNNITS